MSDSFAGVNSHPQCNPTFNHKRSGCLLCKALSKRSDGEVKIPCMAKAALMTTFALSFSLSLPASRSCRQRNGGLPSSLWPQTGCTPGHTRALRKRGFHLVWRHTHTQPLQDQGHNNHRRQGSTSKGPRLCVSLQ